MRTIATQVGELEAGDMFKFHEGVGSGAVFLVIHTHLPSKDHRTVVWCGTSVIQTGNCYTTLLETAMHTNSLNIVKIEL